MEGENLEQGNQGTTDTQSKGTEPAQANGDQSQHTDANTGSKTFTQDDVNAIGAREKNQGKNSILKLFGCADEKSAKTEAEEFKKWKESQKTEEQKKSEAEQKLITSAAESEKRAIAAENKLTALAAGVTAESLDDALAIAQLKVTEDKTLETVFTEMKKEARYSGFFGLSTTAAGTGTTPGAAKKGSSKENIGERLAKRYTSSETKKSSFFSN